MQHVAKAGPATDLAHPVMQVESFHEGFPELCMADDAAVDSIPHTNHVYKRLAQTIPDHDHRRPMFELLKAMLHPDPQLRASMEHVLASSVFDSC